MARARTSSTPSEVNLEGSDLASLLREEFKLNTEAAVQTLAAQAVST